MQCTGLPASPLSCSGLLLATRSKDACLHKDRHTLPDPSVVSMGQGLRVSALSHAAKVALRDCKNASHEADAVILVPRNSLAPLG